MRTTCVWLTGILIVGCVSSPDEPLSQARAPLAPSGSLAGFSHPFSKSHFALGSPSSYKTEFGMQKVVGPWGVFATHSSTGMVLALPNADAPSRAAPPFPGGSEAQNAAVKAYFLSAGLPADQIQGVRTMGLMTASGYGASEEPPAFHPVTSDSFISRQYAGIQVIDSYVWARMNDSSEVVTESVYWPEIPATVLNEANAFAKSLSDEVWKKAFLAKLPPPRNGQLVIHHTPGTWNKAFSAAVSYDVPAGSGGRMLHFDQNGMAFGLPDELPGAWGEAPSMTK